MIFNLKSLGKEIKPTPVSYTHLECGKYLGVSKNQNETQTAVATASALSLIHIFQNFG